MTDSGLAHSTPKRDDGGLVKEGVHTLFLDSTAKGGPCGIVGGKGIVPHDRGAVLVHHFQRPARLVFQADDVNLDRDALFGNNAG